MHNSLFAYNIKLIREYLGFSQEQFGDEIGATRAMIMTYEQRGSKPKQKLISAIEDISGCNYKLLCETKITNEFLSERIAIPTLNAGFLTRLCDTISVLKSVGTIKRQGDIAEDLGYKRPGTISEIVNGKKPATNRFLNAFCEFYGVSINYLKTGTGSAVPNTNTAISDDDHDFALFLRDQRQVRLLTKAMLAHMTDTKLSEIVSWEKGEITADPETQVKFYNFFRNFQ